MRWGGTGGELKALLINALGQAEAMGSKRY
jgi:hypothetical protein